MDYSTPILSLAPDIWTLISCLLDNGELLRLDSVGNHGLSSRIRQGARHLSSTWHGPHFIDFAQVFGSVAPFRYMDSLEFRAEHKYLCHWTPVPWHSLTTQLVHLNLRFSGSVEEIMSTPWTLSRWPNLRSLILEDLQSAKFDCNEICDFSGLPASMEVLRIIATRGIYINPLQLADLPRGLEVLELRFNPLALIELDDSSKAPVFQASAMKYRLPRLPDTITELILRDCEALNWHVVFEDLPKSLRICELDFCSAHHNPKANAEQSIFSSVNLCGIATHLPKLHTFIARNTRVFDDQFSTLIPPSITYLDLDVQKSSFLDEEGVSESTPCIAWASLRRYRLRIRRTHHQTSHSAMLRPMVGLQYLDAIHQDDDALSNLPDTITSLRAAVVFPTMIPPKLVVLKLSNGFLPHPQDVTIPFVFPNTLRRLKMLKHGTGRNLPEEVLFALPDSLEELAASITPQTCNLLFTQMRSFQRFPHLKDIKLENQVTYEALTTLPNQLQKLKIWLIVTADPPSSRRTEKALRSLSQSNLVALRLKLSIADFSNPTPGAVIEFVKNLPTSITKLKLAVPCALTKNWPIVWPPRLKSLIWKATEFSSDFRSPATRNERGPSFAFQFPQTLTRLTLKQPSLPILLLPPYLSAPGLGTDLSLQSCYFETCEPPAHNPELILHPHRKILLLRRD